MHAEQNTTLILHSKRRNPRSSNCKGGSNGSMCVSRRTSRFCDCCCSCKNSLCTNEKGVLLYSKGQQACFCCTKHISGLATSFAKLYLDQKLRSTFRNRSCLLLQCNVPTSVTLPTSGRWTVQVTIHALSKHRKLLALGMGSPLSVGNAR